MGDTVLARRALAILDAALERPDAERASWLEHECDGDATLLREVQALLEATRRSDGILDADALAPEPGGLATALGSALAGSYAIAHEIGRGGMATVFKAHEHKHDRDVVIKVLDPSIAHLFGADRFLREVRIAATLAHPHIVPLIDSGDADGLLYYVMPWMEGETLRERLRRGRPSREEALSILCDVAGALAFAHDAGIVHRDLKPENVLLTAGHAYLLDFGIAKLLEQSPEALVITTPGLPLGTRRYMAPEQAVGAADVDARADIYAWGILGIELLTGVPLPTADAEGAAARLLATHPEFPTTLVALLQACVATAPDRRPATMTDVVEWLNAASIPRAHPAPREAPRPDRRTLAMVGTVAVALLLAVFAVWRRGDTSPPQVATAPGTIAEPVAVAVLRNETGDSTLDVMGRFAGDWVTEGLQRTGLVRVVPWSEARLASDRATAAGAPLVASLRDEVHAGTIVTGSIYRRRDSLHFHGALIDAGSGRQIASLPAVIVPFDSTEAGIAQLRDRVMGAVASMRDERVASLPGLSHSPPSFSAYQAYDIGSDHFVAQRYAESLASFRDAFARDTTFTLSLFMAARAAWNVGDYAVAESLVARARLQRRDLGTYHESSMRYLEALLAGDGEAARAAIQRAVAAAPNSRGGYDYAAALLNAGYARAARQVLTSMDPDRGELRGWSSYWTQRAHAAYMLGRHDEELAAAREMARRYPDRRVALVLEARALASMGDVARIDSALAAWDSLPANVYWSQGAAMVVATEELLRRGREADGRRLGNRAVAWLSNRLVAMPTDRAHRYWLGSVFYDLGDYQAARPYFESLANENPDRLLYRGLAALVAARRGERDGAQRWLGRASPRQTGEYLAYQARLAAIAGDTEQAVIHLTAAINHGVEGYSWLPGSAFRDLAPLQADPRGRALLRGR
jgi:tRNA A-37 threonylcarbamoyl transferase component Bud32/tetratricopeptide (TPR) repeat protein